MRLLGCLLIDSRVNYHSALFRPFIEPLGATGQSFLDLGGVGRGGDGKGPNFSFFYVFFPFLPLNLFSMLVRDVVGDNLHLFQTKKNKK